MKRLIYLAYYFKKLDRYKFNKFNKHVTSTYNKFGFELWSDIIYATLKYNVSILDYFYFKFYLKNKIERKEWAGTGYMYEYQLKMNPKSDRETLSNKLFFLEKYNAFVKHEFVSLKKIPSEPLLVERILSNKSGKIVLKSSNGQCGNGIEVRKSNEFDSQKLLKRLIETKNDFVEEFVVQHDDLMRLSPSGLNTIRIITQINSLGGVDILGARLRISVNSFIDNLAAGNLAAKINIDNGIVESEAVYSDITLMPEKTHPITKVPIIGFKVPFWNETILMSKEAALLYTQNKSIGWDIAITNNGPELIEGNHDWCKLLWQLPVNKGLKSVLESYL